MFTFIVFYNFTDNPQTFRAIKFKVYIKYKYKKYNENLYLLRKWPLPI